MSFIDFLKCRKNFIIIWLIFHSFALFVNVFNIEWVVQKGDRYCLNCQKIPAIHIFTDDEYKTEENITANFWPFTITNTYVYHNTRRYEKSIFYQTKSADEKKIINFGGIFNDYDYSEFLAYNFILLIFFYFKWDRSKKNKA